MSSLLKKLQVRDDVYHGYQTTRWINPDISPLPPSRRTWGYVDYLGFWSIAHLCITAWTGGSALLSLGLTVGETMGAIIIAKALMAFLALGNGWIGAEWHIGFTVAQRITLGMYGSYVGILIRIILSVVWYGSQAWLGGLCVSAMLSSWSHSFLTMENTFPENAHMVTRDFVGFVLFHLISMPFMLIRPENAKYPVAFANVVTFFVMLGITIWAVTKGGTGPLLHEGRSTTPTTISHAWAWLYGITSTVGGVSSGILNQSDFTRFARKQGVQVPGTTFALFVPGIIVPLFGILTASASINIYGGEPFWNPLTIVIQWMTDDYSATSRAAAFFCSLGFIISQLAENILGNGFAAGMDLAGLFPKYINIRRGCLIAALLSWAVQPWLFYNTSSVFVATMASFSVFLAPLTGIMMSDYFIIRRQKIELSALYTGSLEGAYWYTLGINWRALGTWVACFAPAMPGMIASLNLNVVINDGALNYYRGNYLFGFLEGAVLYTILAKVFPPKRLGQVDVTDFYGTFSDEDAETKGMIPFQGPKLESIEGEEQRIEAQDLKDHGLQQTDKKVVPVIGL